MKGIPLIKFSLLTAFLVLITINTGAQSYRQQLNSKGIKLPDAASVRQLIYDSEPAEYKIGIYKDMTYYHSAIMANKLAESLYNGNYYTDWPELEDYLYHIFRLIAPPELVNDTLFRIIIKKDGYFNAFMTNLLLLV
jgi:hypothetical protein